MSFYCQKCGKEITTTAHTCNTFSTSSDSSVLKNFYKAPKLQKPNCERERYYFGKILFQRLHNDIWYAVYNNEIIDYDQYRHDLEERLQWREV